MVDTGSLSFGHDGKARQESGAIYVLSFQLIGKAGCPDI